MAKFKVVTLRSSNDVQSGSKLNYDSEMEALSPIGAEIIEGTIDSEEGFLNQAKDADAIIATYGKITKSMVNGLNSCKIIASTGVGTDGVDVEAATIRGIPVTNVPDTFIEEVADHSMALILSTFRKITTLDTMVRDGRWSEGRPMLYEIPRLMGMTLGLISFGHVARAVAKRAAPFGVRMIAYDPYVEELVFSQNGVEPVGMNELLQRSDIISMHAPGTPETHHMMSEKQFNIVKKGAIFVNNGRGETVDEKALINSLVEGRLASAGLDVFEQEPPDQNNPLLQMDNVILTPHAASASGRFENRRRLRVGQEIALVLMGRWPRACVNPSVLEKSNLARWQPISMERGPAR